ncbi:MAG: DUF1566 domain-containing protein [Woeseiaceae bacterium]
MLLKLFLIISFLIFTQTVYSREDFTKIEANGNEDLFTNDWSCVKNNVTGQVWEASGSNKKYTVEEINNYVKEINNIKLCGYSDWRMPSIKELSGLAINKDYFSFPAHHLLAYWSNTIVADSSSDIQLWYVNYENSRGEYEPNSENYVRLVRGNKFYDFFDYTKLDSAGKSLTGTSTNHACVYDNQNGLTWEVKTNENNSIGYSPSEVNNHVEELNRKTLCGYSDWRLPTTDELTTLVDYGTHSPAISTDYFPNTINKLYRASPDSVYFDSGRWDDRFETEPLALRLVRDGLNLDPYLAKLFNWAEVNYPQYFPSKEQSYVLSGYTVRHYKYTNIYLGEKNGDIYVYGDVFGGLLKVGTFAELLKQTYSGNILNNGDFSLGYSGWEIISGMWSLGSMSGDATSIIDDGEYSSVFKINGYYENNSSIGVSQEVMLNSSFRSFDISFNWKVLSQSKGPDANYIQFLFYDSNDILLGNVTYWNSNSTLYTPSYWRGSLDENQFIGFGQFLEYFDYESVNFNTSKIIGMDHTKVKKITVKAIVKSVGSGGTMLVDNFSIRGNE